MKTTSGDKLKLLGKGLKVSCDFSDSTEKLFISIRDLTQSTTSRSFGYTINTAKPVVNPIPAIQVTQVQNTQKGSPETDYNFSINYSEFITGANTITIYDGTTPISEKKFFLTDDDDTKTVKLDRPGMEPTSDQAFWTQIQKQLWIDITTHSLRFFEYEGFIETVLNTNQGSLAQSPGTFDGNTARRRSPFVRSEEYNLIKFATNFYMMKRFGLDTSQLASYLQNGRLPYYDIIVDRIKDDDSIGSVLDMHNSSNLPALDPNANESQKRTFHRLYNPIMIELIWNYWMEQGMLVQTMNVINLRFQNIKGNNYRDPLTRFDTDPLRPLSHVIWGYIQDEQHRLSLPRRVNEYDHEYGLTLIGRAVPRISPLDTRVKFLEAFHSLLTLCTIYFKESDDTTRIADAFPILNSLREVHLILAEGNHNAYGNLTWTARQEMMMQQYILSRPEMREFLGGRVMVPYPETWMDRVDTMRNLQGWGGTGIIHYYELAIHGELILLSVRYGNWSDVTLTSFNAANWAQTFRNSIQRYIHAYRSVAGIDLAVDQVINLPNTFAVQPSHLIQQRLLEERRRRA